MSRQRKTLSEGGYYEVSQGMRIASSASKHFENVLGGLKNCKVSVDEQSFKNVKFYLDKIHADLAAKVLEHADALDGKP